MLENNIKKLIKILEESTIDELEVSTFWGRQNIRIKRNSPTSPARDNVLTVSDHEKNIENSKNVKDSNVIANEENKEDTESDVAIKDSTTVNAPLVGTFYTSSKPGTPPFISKGDHIEKGQIICIIEAMKIFNEIESEYSGKVLNILVEDGTPVEYDQPLISISLD